MKFIFLVLYVDALGVLFLIILLNVLFLAFDKLNLGITPLTK